MSLIARLMTLKVKCRRANPTEELFLRINEELEIELASLRFDEVGPLATDIALKGPEAAIGPTFLGMTTIWRADIDEEAIEENEIVKPHTELSEKERADTSRSRKPRRPARKPR
ncbi:hypothetical protein [Myxococcus faecalis]|uniref:hypothetical protein n=1 Tax=Myxococcus faecalis TaxID=3115646 RepID=UPI003CF98B44